GVLEARVALLVRFAAGVHDRVDPIRLDRGVNLGAGRVSYAMDRPRTALLGERIVIRWMPIPRRHDVRELPRQPVDLLDHRIAIRHLEGTASTEVVLDIDDD